MLRLIERPLDYENGLPQTIPFSIEDIADLIESLKALGTSENRFRRLFDTAQDGIPLIDPLTRKIVNANPSIVELLGMSREALLGRELWEVGLLKGEQSSHMAFRELRKHTPIRLTAC